MRQKSKGKQLRVRCWIDIDGERFFGPGRAELLQLIQETGSISKAAKSMGMSYKKAWEMVEGLNANGRKPYVIAHKGGRKGWGNRSNGNWAGNAGSLSKTQRQGPFHCR